MTIATARPIPTAIPAAIPSALMPLIGTATALIGMIGVGLAMGVGTMIAAMM